MQQFEFFLGIRGSEAIQKAEPYGPASGELLRHPEIIPGELLSSSARFRFISHVNCKPHSGLNLNCKLIGGLP